MIFSADQTLSRAHGPWSRDIENLSEPFSVSELQAALVSLNKAAAVGPQRISSRVLFDVFLDPAARNVLLSLVNRCFLEGTIPSPWGVSEVFVLYKGSGSLSDPNAYRGINLTNDFYRIYERLLNVRLQQWYKSCGIFSELQFGFLEGKGTAEAYFVFQSLTQALKLSSGKTVFCCFVDLQKAFPSLQRSALINLLYQSGCPIRLVNAVASSFSANFCYLRVDNFVSPVFSINRGTREGGITSPGLFNAAYGIILSRCGLIPPPNILQVDSLNFKGVYGLAYADDLCLISCDRTELQSKLAALKHELSFFGMSLNISKTKLMLFRSASHRVTDPENVFVAGRALEIVSEFKYLGFWVSDRLWPSIHVQRCTPRIFSAAHQIGSLMSRLEITDPIRLGFYFKSFVRSQFYGSQFFVFHPSVQEKAVAIFVRRALQLPRSFSGLICVSFLNIEPFETFQLRTMLKFAQKILNSDDSILKGAFYLDR